MGTEEYKEILVVEDNNGDVHLLQHAFLQYGRLLWRLYRVADGEAALAFLRREGVYATMPRPQLVILDIGLPALDGWEVLQMIRATPVFATLPVVMLTGVMAPRDEAQRTALMPLACLVKPMNLEDYQSLVEELERLLLGFADERGGCNTVP